MEFHLALYFVDGFALALNKWTIFGQIMTSLIKQTNKFIIKYLYHKKSGLGRQMLNENDDFDRKNISRQNLRLSEV